MVLKWFRIHCWCCKIYGLAKHQCECLCGIHRLGVLSVDLSACAVELDGPVSRTVLCEDLVVLEAGLDSPGIHV